MVDVLIQTRDEELNLPHALRSVAGWAGRIFVVDSGSTDRTRDIAREFGATVVEKQWLGYAKQKNWALDNLPFESPWILILDADEAVTPALRDEIIKVVNRPADEVPQVGFYLNRVLIFLGQKIWHCGYYPSWNLRLFKRGHARYEERRVHEHMVADGPVGHLRHLLLHEDRRGLEHFVAKHNRYSTLEAQSLYDSRIRWPGLRRMISDRVTRTRFLKERIWPHLPVPWVIRFLYMYIVRLGILDRRPGWLLCNFIASYDLFVYAKYKELRRLRGKLQHDPGGLTIPEGFLPLINGSALAAREKSAAAEAAPRLPAEPPSTEAACARMPQRFEPAQEGKAPVSVLIPTLNEASNLPRCLDHLQWADEVVVVDSGSKDGTRRIAESYGARVIDFRWNGQWPKKKNWALRNVDFKHEWVLIVDADEWITPELAGEIATAVKSNQHVGYYINRRFIFMGRWIRHCGYYPSWNLRLIRRGCGEYETLTGIGDTGSGDNEVHEHVVANGSVGHLGSDMLHLAFPTIHVFMEKHNRYSNWEAAVQYQNTGGTSAVTTSTDLSRRRRLKNFSRRLPFRPLLRFLYAYVWKRGFLDGRAGYIFCRLLAIYEYLSVAKYQELTMRVAEQEAGRQLSSVPSLAPALLERDKAPATPVNA